MEADKKAAAKEEVGDTTEEEFKPDLDKLPEGLKTYLRGRVFNYLHHFSGAEDKLGRAIEQSASLLGMVVRVESCDLKVGVDLATDTPYRAQLKKAKAGGYDGYHSDFPCSTFWRARFKRWKAHQARSGPRTTPTASQTSTTRARRKYAWALFSWRGQWRWLGR